MPTCGSAVVDCLNTTVLIPSLAPQVTPDTLSSPGRMNRPFYRPEYRCPCTLPFDVTGDPIVILLPNPDDGSPGGRLPVDALLCLLTHCDWYALMTLSRGSRGYRAAVRCEIGSRMAVVIQPFIPLGTLNSFVHMLDDTGAAVVGSVCRRLLASASHYTHPTSLHSEGVKDKSFDLNLLVPSAGFNMCIRWFVSQGYTMGGASVEWPYGGAVSEIVNGYLPVSRLHFAVPGQTQLEWRPPSMRGYVPLSTVAPNVSRRCPSYLPYSDAYLN